MVVPRGWWNCAWWERWIRKSACCCFGIGTLSRVGVEALVSSQKAGYVVGKLQGCSLYLPDIQRTTWSNLKKYQCRVIFSRLRRFWAEALDIDCWGLTICHTDQMTQLLAAFDTQLLPCDHEWVKACGPNAHRSQFSTLYCFSLIICIISHASCESIAHDAMLIRSMGLNTSHIKVVMRPDCSL